MKRTFLLEPCASSNLEKERLPSEVVTLNQVVCFMFCGSLKQETAVLCSVYFIATDMASKRLQTTLKKAEGPYGWMTSAAQEKKPVSFSVPGHRGDGMTAAIGKTWAWPATPAARDTGSPRVRTCHHARASEFSSHSTSLHCPHYEAFLSFGFFSLFP